MREILFRGKTYNSEWLYGYCYKVQSLLGSEFRWYIRNDYQKDSMVMPETIGQYTGLKDRNGKKIFEGDIVRYPHSTYYGKHDDTYIVQFSRNMGCQYWLHNTKEDSLHPSLGMCKGSEKIYEVIGNIYERNKRSCFK